MCPDSTENIFQETGGTVWIKFTEGNIPERSPSASFFYDVKRPTGYTKRNILGDNAFSLIINLDLEGNG